MPDDPEVSSLVQLSARPNYRPDTAALARDQLATARKTRDLSFAEFAELLTPLVSWPVTAHAVESWESASVPPGDVLVAAGLLSHVSGTGADQTATSDVLGRIIRDRFSDVTAIYRTRSEFVSSLPPHALFDGARHVRAVGLSLNLICQQYADENLRHLIKSGTTFRCLFLDPNGDAMKARESEEGYPRGHLAALTGLNIQTLQEYVKGRLPAQARKRLVIATYDQTLRFNILLVNSEICVAQPYLPATRGLDSPTFVIHRRWATAGLFPVFAEIFDDLWRTRSQV